MSPLQETRIALRRLLRRPGESLVAVLALALGIVAVGARRGDLAALVVRGGLAPVGLGLLPGLALGLLFARLVTAFLYRVESTGLLPLTVVATTLLATGFLASWLPARWAAGTDPIAALRAE